MDIKMFFFGRCKKHSIRIVPRLGLIREQQGPVVPTPQFRGPKRGILLMSFQMTDSQQVPLTVSFVDKKGNPVANPSLSGVPTWSVDNPNVLALTPASDGLSCNVAAVGPVGSGIVTFDAKANLGNGPIDVTGTLEIDIVPGAATQVTINPGTPTEQP